MKNSFKAARTILVTILNVLMVSAFILVNTAASYAADRSAIITSVTTNQSNYTGPQIVTVTLTARNTGSGPVQLRGGIRILNPDGTTVFSQSARYDLGQRESDSNYFRWQIPQSATTGYYKVQAEIRDGLNNSFYDSGSTSFYYRSELPEPGGSRNTAAKITNVTTNKNSYTGREIVTVTVNARNIGSGPVQLRGLVQIYDPNGKMVFSQTARYDLASQETDSNGFSWQIPDGATSGNYRVIARIINAQDNKVLDSGLATFFYTNRGR